MLNISFLDSAKMVPNHTYSEQLIIALWLGELLGKSISKLDCDLVVMLWLLIRDYTRFQRGNRVPHPIMKS